MKIEDYPAFCASIWQLPRDKSLAVAGLGIVGEACEVAEALLDPAHAMYNDDKVEDECGDVLYYATVLADEFDVDIVELFALNVGRTIVSARQESGLRLCAAAKEVSEPVKKLIRDDKDPTQMRERLARVLECLQAVLNGYGRNLADALDGNVAKLTKRYCVDCGRKRPCVCLENVVGA